MNRSKKKEMGEIPITRQREGGNGQQGKRGKHKAE